MTLNLMMNSTQEDLKPRITVFGVGGAGGNAVNNMIEKELEGVEFVVANTDAQALQSSRADARIQMGLKVTEGLGAGAKPTVGAAAAEETIEEIIDHLAGAHMCFITAGMGGGTGSGMFIDCCYLLRRLLSEAQIARPEVHGVLFAGLPRNQQLRDQSRVNQFALAQDLLNLCQAEAEYRPMYEGFSPKERLVGPPVTTAHFFDLSAEHIPEPQEEVVMDAAVEWMTHSAVSRVGRGFEQRSNSARWPAF